MFALIKFSSRVNKSYRENLYELELSLFSTRSVVRSYFNILFKKIDFSREPGRQDTYDELRNWCRYLHIRTTEPQPFKFWNLSTNIWSISWRRFSLGILEILGMETLRRSNFWLLKKPSANWANQQGQRFILQRGRALRKLESTLNTASEFRGLKKSYLFKLFNKSWYQETFIQKIWQTFNLISKLFAFGPRRCFDVIFCTK